MSKKVVFDIGHGGTDSGAISGSVLEKDLNLEVGKFINDLIAAYDVEVHFTRLTDKYLSLMDRAAVVNSVNPDLCWSVHHNWAEAKTARGAEMIDAYHDALDDVLSNDYLARMKEIGMPTRRRFTRLNEKGEEWYAMIRNIWDDDTDAVISEGGFLSNASDLKLLTTPGFLYNEAAAIVEAVAKYLNLPKAKQTLIAGPSALPMSTMEAWLKVSAPEYVDLVPLYYAAGGTYGIRADLAICQAVKETGYFGYTGIVKPYQNNYCGLAATGVASDGSTPLNGADPNLVSFQKGVHGAVFKTRVVGVTAHMQHLYAYVCGDPLPHGEVLVDPRFTLVKRGTASRWLDLNGKWAVPGDGYGQSIVALLEKAKEYTASQAVTDKPDAYAEMLTKYSELESRYLAILADLNKIIKREGVNV